VRRLEIHRLAERELNRAAQRYQAESPGLGTQFLDELQLCIRSVLIFPLAGTEIAPGVRRRLLPRFPFGVLYSIRPDTIRVLAVMHLKRDPEYWVGRR
jgi:plasmid stabilization system protein ParE